MPEGYNQQESVKAAQVELVQSISHPCDETALVAEKNS